MKYVYIAAYKFTPLISCCNFTCVYSFVDSYLRVQGAYCSIFAATDPILDGVEAEYFFHCESADPSAAALDVDAAVKLWDISLKVTGLVNGAKIE